MLLLAVATYLIATASDKPDQPVLLIAAHGIHAVVGVVTLFNIAWTIAGNRNLKENIL
jgi:hypothetical protein